ncbi:tetratricopeptide repeat protein [Spirosoma montaniterrae]|uniref:Tetratricopeptide repeat protein n=1 Tax=Spirosoma montaniterrae TaxID=1178516 RepID=A0A1P9X0M1_9BACT|nr:tetratricopeptide repeat protein [Spirosoma montaniterrae]AQG81148.1 hypothetical protein AWR27_18570 [Spirosoma montaniterrae]
MIRLALSLSFFPLLASAQTDDSHFLQSCASMLAANRAAPTQFFFSTKREQNRLDTATATGPNYRLRALNYVWLRHYEQAAQWFEKAAEHFPKEHGAAGEFYFTFLRDTDRALRHLNAFDALTVNFDDHINHNPVSYLRGLVYRDRGNHPKAIEQFCIAIDSLEKKHGAEWVNYRHYVSRAVSYLATQQPGKALLDLDKAAHNYPKSPLVQYQRGVALRQLGRTAEARTALQDASFFYKQNRAQRGSYPQEDDNNPLFEPDIDAAIDALPATNRN